MQELIAAKDIQPGEYFVKRTGQFAYLRISESAIRFLRLDDTKVYGVCYNGNMSVLEPETLVKKTSLFHMYFNKKCEEAWEDRIGVTK